MRWYRSRAVVRGWAGIRAVTSLLTLRGDGMRWLCVDPSGVHTIAEYGTGAFATSETGRKRDPSEKPVNRGDHATPSTPRGTRRTAHADLGAHSL